MAFWDGAGSAILSAGASLFGGLLGSSSNESANQTNLQIARETNEQNYKMFHEQQDWNEMMWNKMNAYNTPLMQKERLRAAGINPYAMLGSNGQGTMGQVGLASSASPAPAQGAAVQPYDWSPSMAGVGRAIDSYFQNQNQDAQTDILRIQAVTQLDDQISKIAEVYSRISLNLSNKNLTDEQRKNMYEQTEHLKETLDILRKTKQSQIELTNGNLALQKQQQRKAEWETEKARLDAEYQKQFNAVFGKMSAAQIAVYRSQAAQAWENVNLTKQMTKTEKERTAREVTENMIANMRKHGLSVEQAQQEQLYLANLEQIQATTRKIKNSDNFLQNYSPFASFAGQGATLVKAIK